MDLKGKIEQHPVAAVATCCVLLAGICYFSIPGLVTLVGGGSTYKPPSRGLTSYFYDQNTGEIIVGPASDLGPIETDSGPYEGRPAGVRAQVHACRSCDDPDDRFIAWLEMPTAAYMGDDPELLEKYTVVVGEDEEIAFAMVRRVDDAHWVRGDTSEAKRIYADFSQRCPKGQRPHFCRPPARRTE